MTTVTNKKCKKKIGTKIRTKDNDENKSSEKIEKEAVTTATRWQ